MSGITTEQRQVFDIPQPKINVTEHRVEEKSPCCGERTRASFPENVKGPTKYGDRVRALIAYFSHQHFIPVDRVCENVEAYYLIQQCLYQLNKQGINHRWKTIRNIMKGRIRVTMQAKTEDGKTLYYPRNGN